MRKTIEQLEVGDWFCAEGMLTDMYCSRPGQVTKINGKSVEFAGAPDRDGCRETGRKLIRLIREVFDSQRDAEEFSKFVSDRYWELTDAKRNLEREYRRRCIETAKLYTEPNK